MYREHKTLWRRHILFDEMNAHCQADEQPLAYVIEFNADEREWQKLQDRRRRLLEQIDAAPLRFDKKDCDG